MSIIKFFSVLTLVISLNFFIGCSKAEDNNMSSINNKNTTTTNPQLNVDLVMDYLKSDNGLKNIYGDEDVAFLIKKFNQGVNVAKVNQSNFVVSVNIDDGIVKISGEATVIPSFYEIEVSDVVIQDSTISYVINPNPTNESIQNNIMNYIGENIYGAYIPSMIFLPLEGENSVTVKDVYYKKDNSISNLSITIDFVHSDAAYNSTGSMYVLINDNNNNPERKLPKVSVSNYNAINTNNTIPPSITELEKCKPDILYVPNKLGTKLTLREYDSVKFLESTIVPGSLSKGIINASYISDVDNEEKSIILDFYYKIANNKYEIHISNNTRSS